MDDYNVRRLRNCYSDDAQMVMAGWAKQKSPSRLVPRIKSSANCTGPHASHLVLSFAICGRGFGVLGRLDGTSVLHRKFRRWGVNRSRAP
jgi:hypothetical protein